MAERDGGGRVRLLNASGCLDALAAPEVARRLDAFVTKTITPEPREGNPPVRIAETPLGMLNAIGLANPGRERFLRDHLPALATLGVPVWVSVGGFCAGDYAETCAALDGVQAIELNLSCPNVDEAADGAAEIVAACRAVTPLPLYAKLSAAHPDVAEVARAVADAGADGLSLINTLRGRGTCIVFTSHRWNEVKGIADRITIYRNGETVGIYAAADLSEQEAVERIEKVSSAWESAASTR